MLGILLNVFVIAVFGWVMFTFVRAYLASTGLWYERVWAASKQSATVLWAQTVIVAVGVLDFIDVVANYLSAGAGDQLKSAVDPKYGAAVLVAIMLVTIVARLRRLWQGISS